MPAECPGGPPEGPLLRKLRCRILARFLQPVRKQPPFYLPASSESMQTRFMATRGAAASCPTISSLTISKKWVSKLAKCLVHSQAPPQPLRWTDVQVMAASRSVPVMC